MQLDSADMLVAIFTPAGLASLEPLTCILLRARPSFGGFCMRWISCSIGVVIAEVINGAPTELAAGILNLLLAVLCWWLSRRKRKLAAKLLGAKAKALRAALVRTMRERARPRRVLRPVPGGAW